MKRIFIYLLPMVMLLSCSKSLNDDNTIDTGETTDKTLTIMATKSSEDGVMDEGYESFSSGDAMRIGLFSYSDDKTSLETYSDILTTDIYVKCNSAEDDEDEESDYWTYGYGREGTSKNLAYKEITDKNPILAAYYPYRDAADLMHIPFKLSDKQGLMWCEPVEVTNDNRDGVSLQFHHSMAKININVGFSQTTSTSYVYYPVLPRIFGLEACEGTVFVESASYNATNGTFSEQQEVSGILVLNTYSNNTNDNGVYTLSNYDLTYEVTIYLVPELEFNGFEIRLAWEGSSSDNYVYLEGLNIGKDQIAIDGVAQETLKAGYEYTYNITVNNYLKFEGITISNEWIDNTDAPFSGNI